MSSATPPKFCCNFVPVIALLHADEDSKRSFDRALFASGKLRVRHFRGVANRVHRRGTAAHAQARGVYELRTRDACLAG